MAHRSVCGGQDRRGCSIQGNIQHQDKKKRRDKNYLKQGYNGDLTSKQAGSVGGQMVKKMIESYENGLK